MLLAVLLALFTFTELVADMPLEEQKKQVRQTIEAFMKEKNIPGLAVAVYDGGRSFFSPSASPIRKAAIL